MIKIKKIIFITLSVICFIGVCTTISYARDQKDCSETIEGQIPDPDCALQNVKSNIDSYKSQEPDTTTPEFYAGALIQTILIYVGTVFLILMLYAGVNWMLANGNPDRIAKSQSILKHSIIGLIVVVFAYSIALFVVQRAEKIKNPVGFSRCELYTNQTQCEQNTSCVWVKSNDNPNGGMCK
jgi:hypothetical protein